MSKAWTNWIAEYQKAGDTAQVAMLNELSDSQRHYLKMVLPLPPMRPLARIVTIVAFFSFLVVLFDLFFIAVSMWFRWFPC